MPLYEFQCNICGYIFEEICKKFEPTKISSSCPVCKENGKTSIAKKIISKTSFVINGYNAKNGYSK